MWLRSLAIGLAIVFGVVFGFVLSSCMPPVDGQSSEFPPLTIGETYELRFTPNLAFGSEPSVGILTEIGPYPWIEMDVNGLTVQANLSHVAYFVLAPE